MPSRSSMKKNMADHNCGIGIFAKACGKTTKTKPGPSVITFSTSLPCSNAKLPMVEKTQNPQMMQVTASTMTTIKESFKIGPWKGLYEAKATKHPKAMPTELK